MRKIFILSTTLLFCTLLRTAAQSTANYSFATSTTGSLALDMNGNTIDMSSGTTQLVSAGSDDSPSPLTNLNLGTGSDIEFFFMGARYTQFSASDNGVMCLGAQPSGSLYSVSNSSTATLAPFANDLRVGTDGKVEAKVFGTAPNRVLVVQWTNAMIRYTTAAAGTATWQVRMYESTGVIQYVYGKMTTNSSSPTSYYVGFSKNTTANNILTVNTTANTASTTASLTTNSYTASSTITALNSTVDGSRKTYTFTPPAISAIPSALTFTAITASTMTLNWIAAAPVTGIVGYAIYSSTDGINYSFLNTVPVGTNTLAVTGLIPSTNYSYRIYSISEGAISNTFLAGTQATAPVSTYYWVGTAAADFNTGTNWNTQANGTGTTRTADPTDLLIIDGDGIVAGAATTLSLSANQSVGVLQITNNTDVTLLSSSTTTRTITITGGAGTDLDVPAGSSLTMNNTTNAAAIAFTGTGNTGNIAGTLTLGGNTGNKVTTTGGTGTVVTVTGTVNSTLSSATALLVGSTSTLVFANGSNCNISGFTTTNAYIPTATWGATSNLNLSGGTTGTGITNSSTSFGNVTFNSSTLTATLSAFATSTITIQGNLTIQNTNTGTFRMVTSGTVTIGGDFTINGGTVDLASGAGTVKLAGSFNQLGGTLNASGTTGSFEFNGITTQNANFGTVGTGTLNVRINNAAGVDVGGTLPINSGGTLTISKGNITGNGNITYNQTSSKLVYNSTTGAQTASPLELPGGGSGPASLTINNTATAPNNVVSIPFSTSLGTTGVLALTAGILDNTNNTLSITNTATGAITGGSSTSFIKGAVERNLPANLATGSTYLFPVGKSVYNQVELVNPTTNAGGIVTIHAEAFDAATGGSAGTNVSAINPNRYWNITTISGAGNLTNTNLRLYDAPVSADGIAVSNTLTGMYDLTGGGNPTTTATSITSTVPLTSIGNFYVLATRSAPVLSNLAITPTSTSLCTNAQRTVTVTVTPASAAISTVALNYSVNGTPQTPVAMTNTGGNNWSGDIPTVTPVNAAVTWSVIATDVNGIAKTMAGVGYQDAPLFGLSAYATSTATSLCSGSSATLTAIPPATYTPSAYSWSDGSTVLGTSNTLSVTPAANANYTATLTINGCTLVTNTVNMVVNSVPTAPTATNSTQCGVGIPTASVASTSGTGSAAQFFWYSAATGGTLLQTPPNYFNYTNNFSSSTLTNSSLSGNASITGGVLQITPNSLSQTGGFTVNASGVNSSIYQTDFDMVLTSSGTDMADGMSYNFADDAVAGATTPSAEHGTGSKLRICFDTYNAVNGTDGMGIWVMYGASTTLASGYTTSTPGVLGYVPYIGWIPNTNTTQISHVTVSINTSGQLTLTVGGIVIYNNLQLPTAFTTANKSTWKHVFSARTGGISGGFAIDNLNIQGSVPGGGSPTYLSSISNTTTFYVSEIGAGGCEGPRTPVTAAFSSDSVSALANAIPASTSICLGASLNLSALHIGNNNNYTYSWTATPATGSGITTSLSGGPQTITPTVAGTYVYTLSATDGSCGNTSTVTVTVAPLPAVTISATSTSSCGAAPTTLTAVPAVSSISWSDGSTIVGTTNPLTINNTTTTTYTATVTVAGNSCPSTTNAVTVTVNPVPSAPTATNSTQCGAGIPTALIASTAGATGTGTFNWYSASTGGTLLQAPPYGTTLNTYYTNDFSTATLTNSAISGNASIANGTLTLTPNTTSQQGGLTINASGANATMYQTDFDMILTASGTTIADGLSYNFGDDVSATITSPSPEHGSGTKLRICFDSYGSGADAAGIYVMYGASATLGSGYTASTPGVLGYLTNTSWVPNNNTVTTHVTAAINASGQLTLTVGGTAVYTNLQLPAAFVAADKSTWKHVISARTGGIAGGFVVDNVNIQANGFVAGSATYLSTIAASTTFYVSETGSGTGACPSARTAVTATVTTPTGLAASGTSATNAQGLSATFLYKGNSCDAISAIATTTAALGSTTAAVTVDGTVQTYNAQPYVQRHTMITPTTTGASTVTLYALQSEFTAYNAVAGSFSLLPATGSNTDPNISNIKVTSFAGTTPSGIGTMLTPSSVNWNGNYWEITVPSATTSGSFYIHTGTAPLTIKLLNISGRNVGSRNRIDWSTASELKGDKFILQRSADGISYTDLGTIDAQGKASSYTYFDEKPLAGINHYRLHMIGTDGDDNYSKTVDIMFGGSDVISVNAFPNPAHDLINVKVYGADQEGDILITDIAGKVIKSVKTNTSETAVNIGDMASGVYLIKYVSGTYTKTLKFTKN